MRKPKHFLLILLTLSFLLTGCAADNVKASPSPSVSSPAKSNSAKPESSPADSGKASLVTDEEFASYTAEQKADYLVSVMTLQEKIGQMIQAERASVSPDEIKKYSIGSILNEGGSVPAGNTPEAWADETDAFQDAAAKSRLGIPLIWGVDGVHGHNTLNGATVFPHNIGLGAANDPELMTKIGRITAQEMTACGISWDFAPCLANPMDIRWGRTYEGYGQDTGLISSLGGAYVKGLSEKAGTLGMTACAKHYIGEGYTEGGKNQGNAVFDDLDASLQELVKPYDAAIKNGALTVMISFSSINGVKCHADKHIITEVLKDKLGFKGFVISDYEAVAQLDGPDKKKVASAVNAGVDMLMAPKSWRQYIPMLISLVESGDISEERINDAVRRILTVKAKLCLFENAKADRSLIAKIGCDENRAVARQAVRESLVLLKNDGGAIKKLKNAKKILVAGYGADNIGMQCGGWTITWQGGLQIEQKGTTFLKAISSIEGKEITYSDSGSKGKKFDAAVVVVGEKPYAETFGDDGNMMNPNPPGLVLDDESKKLVASVKADHPGVPLVLILYSGRPLIINEELKTADAVIAAWLPGSEGAGITDVLFGDCGFKGKLRFPWPADAEQTKTVFNVGYGLD